MMKPSVRRLFLTAATVFLTTAACAQDWAKAMLAKSPRHGEFVTITEPNGRKLQAWVVYPEVKEKAPVVVMIHEIFGQSDWAREMADEVASAGYIVVEPDLLSGFAAPGQGAITAKDIQRLSQIQTSLDSLHLSGMGCDPMACPQKEAPSQPHFVLAGYQQQQPVDHSHMSMPMQSAGAAMISADPGGTSAFPPDMVTRAVSSLPPAQVMADLDAAADYSKKLPAANGKLYVAGFCWGGGNSFLFATHRKDLSAAFVFYGPPPPAEAMKNINAPVYGFYAGNDARISATIPQTVIDMKAAGKIYEPVTYDGAGHGFMRAGEDPAGTAPNSAARAEGFRRLVTLLGGVH